MWTYICVCTQNTKRCVFIITKPKNTTPVTPPHTRLSQHKEKNDNTLPRPNEKSKPIPTSHPLYSTCHSSCWSTCPQSINFFHPEPGTTHKRKIKLSCWINDPNSWINDPNSWINDPNSLGSMIQRYSLDQWSKSLDQWSKDKLIQEFRSMIQTLGSMIPR